jgi:transcriptional regulator with XRE-family HTH domain
MPTLSNRIRELREARGMTLADLAERVGTTNQQISHLELGKRQLTVDWLRRLGVALGCHPWAVVEEEDPIGSKASAPRREP